MATNPAAAPGGMGRDLRTLPPLPDFQALFESVPDLYLVLDPDFRIVAASDHYLGATMTAREQIIGRHLFEVFPDNPDDLGATGVSNLRASLERVRRELVPDTMAVQKYDIRRPDSEGGGFEVRYWSPHNSPVVVGGTLAYIIHRVEDVTEFVQLRELESEHQELTEDLQEQTAQMEVEILHRSRELQEANRQLRAANQAKSEFLSRMSHELRTPLNAVLGFGQLLEMDGLEGDQAQSVEQILKAGRHLLGLIDEVLDIARIDSGRLAISMEPVHVHAVVQETVDLVRPMAERHGITVQDRTAGDDHVRADRQRLKQVFLNLASNAVKYNREGGTVTFSFTRTGEELEIHVVDTGRGIAPEKLSRVFVPFDRLGAESSDIEGTGIGLSLSKRLVELMNGRIEVRSTFGQGSDFSVRLSLVPSPVELLAHDVDEVAEPAPVGTREATVLYIEDNLSNLKLVEHVLARRPVKLLAAMQGGLGLELAREHHPDLILLDLHMPGMTGEEVLAALREDPETASTPVVILSADAMPRTVERLYGQGVKAYLTKPLDVAMFLGIIDEILEG